MLDLRWILSHREEMEACLRNRHHDFDLNVLASLDEERRKIIGQTEELKARRNEVFMRLRICRAFHLPWWHYPESVIVPMAKWAMPTKMYDHYHRKAKNRK